MAPFSSRLQGRFRPVWVLNPNPELNPMSAKPTITLVNGPYNGRVLEDSGAVEIKMHLSTNGEVKGAEIGDAIYEPTPCRTSAFWSHNNWIGTLEQVTRVEGDE